MIGQFQIYPTGAFILPRLAKIISSLGNGFKWSWWRHQMETFSGLLALCAGNSPVPVNSPHKGQWHGALMFSLIYAWINDWVNNREAVDLRRYRGHYDVTVMLLIHAVSPTEDRECVEGFIFIKPSRKTLPDTQRRADIITWCLITHLIPYVVLYCIMII